jgi:hypothetical protein
MRLDLGRGVRLVLAGVGDGWGALWLVLGIVALVLLVALYREERRLVSRRARGALLVLRLAAAATLAAMLFEPILQLRTHVAERGRVIVAADVSASMATTDGDKGLSRCDVVRQLIADRSPDSAFARIAAEHPVVAMAFARNTSPHLTLSSLAEELARQVHDDPTTLMTDWQPVLEESLRIAESVPVVGVVLLTDGRRNAPGDDGEIAARLAARGIPVYPVVVGSSTPPRDAAVASLSVPEVLYQGDQADVKAVLKLDGYAGQDVAVTLQRPGAAPLQQIVRAPDDSARPIVPFRVQLDTLGSIPLTVTVNPPKIAGSPDARSDNDSRTARVQVTDDRARVLLLDTEARWEFRYLHDALSRDRRIALQTVLLHPPDSASAIEPTYPTQLPDAAAQEGPSEHDPRRDQDVVIVGDVDGLAAVPGLWERLESYVTERGGTLLISPGPKFWPAAHISDPALRRLLPVENAQVVAFDTTATDPIAPSLPPGVPIVPTTAALGDSRAWPMLQLGDDSKESRGLWSNLPRLPWVLAGHAKQGATVLATAREPKGGRPGQVETAVIAAHRSGLGKVLWIGTDATWRWRYRVGDAYHQRFWGQAVRWAASERLTAGNDSVRFGPIRPRIAEGEGARIRARIAERVSEIRADLLIAARIVKAPQSDRSIHPAEAETTMALVPLRTTAEAGPRTFEGIAPALPAGSYSVRLEVPQLAQTTQLEAALEVQAPETSELVELAASRPPLERLAAATAGRVFDVKEIGILPPLLRARTVLAPRDLEIPLWSHPAALVAVFALLSAEWLVRKHVGLP